ncbi:MAG: tRNA uridine-5-carboxymethylaminomethyl(34) synthesis GTPase MnmE [Clostridiales bacterium]|nr:tRNA uridine-5-carboxymethylaminomethyl(34) synthesis GTPase MnmE [Clostridiales bacterium]
MTGTIYAPSTAVGGAIAIIRLSGEGCVKIARVILDRDIMVRPRELCRVSVMDGARALDDCMAVYLPAPRTYTGEAMLEIHCHGGPRTVQRILSRLAQTGARPAAAGEFSRCAFLNGKMDLSQAEAVMDIIQAESEQALSVALGQLHGSLSRRIQTLQEELVAAQAGMEAAIDYPDEVEAEVNATLPEQLRKAREGVARLIAEGRTGRILRDGLRVAILGRPNVGKSCLLNVLAGEDRAIVTPHAGTTRDVLDAKILIDGVPVRLFDTAGIRPEPDEVESIGIARARELAARADLILLVMDASEPLTDTDEVLLAETADRPRLLVANKSDLLSDSGDGSLCHRSDMTNRPPVTPDQCVSAKTGEGLEELKTAIVTTLAPNRHDETCITNERHLHALEQAQTAIQAALAAEELEEIATDVREALHALGGITGSDVNENVIDEIFERFCVGK